MPSAITSGRFTVAKGVSFPPNDPPGFGRRIRLPQPPHPLTSQAPMDFQSRIDQDLKEAMKARQAERLGVIRMLKSALKLASIEQGGMDARLDDAAALAIVRKELKKRQDAVEGVEKGKRP